MVRISIKNWWVLTAKGVVTLAFGIAALTLDIQVMNLLAGFFSIFLLISGLVLASSSLVRKRTPDKSWRLTEGFIDIVMGTVILSYTAISADMFFTIIAIWISFMGILQVSNGYRLRGLYHHWGLLIFNGLMAIAFAAIILTHTFHGVFTKAVLIGLQSIFFGSFLIVSSYYIKKLLNNISIDIPHKQGEEGNQELSYY